MLTENQPVYEQKDTNLLLRALLCSGEGAINVAMGQNRGQEVRVNGPLAAANQMRMDVGFPMQQGPGME